MLRLALLAFLVVPLGSAQILLEDPEGDQVVYIGGQPFPDPAGLYRDADMVRLTVDELERSIVFTLETAGPPADDWFLATINFTYGGSDYWLKFDQHRTPLAELFKQQEWRDPRVFELDVADNARSVAIPKDQLTDASGAAGLVGTELRVHQVVAVKDETILDQFLAVDSIEEDGSLVLVLGGSESRDVRLGSPLPVRVSNGAATVYAYELKVQNLLAEPTVIELDSRNDPNAWSVRFPVDVVHLRPDEERTVPVLVSVPFMHQHGAYQGFWVEARHFDQDALLSEVELGVRFTEVPQLAGHHDRAWFHASLANSPNPHGPIFFSTLDEHPLDEGVEARAECAGSVGASYGWKARLDTMQHIGLDFDVTKPILLRVPITTPVPMTSLTADVTFWVGEYIIAEVEGAVVPDLESGTTELEFPLPINAQHDELPADNPRTVEVWIWIRNLDNPGALATCVATPPTWSPGGSIEFPLFEYQDPLPLAADTLLTGQDAPRGVAPGSRLSLQHEIEGPPRSRFELRLFGLGAQDAALSPATTVETDAAGRATFDLQVSVPVDADPGQVYDLVVEASSGSLLGLHRTAFTVNDDGALPVPEMGPVDNRDVPFSLSLVVVALALTLARRRA